MIPAGARPAQSPEPMQDRALPPAPSRHSRLFPPRTSSRYYHLTRLREALVAAATWIPPDAAVLVDLGCGAMPYRPIFAPLVRRYVGVDLPRNPEAHVQMPTDGRVPLADASVDVVLSSQVLEHVESPAAYLAECRRILRPGGLLILSTHGYWLYHPDPTDYWRWTSSGLVRQLHLAGLEVRHMAGVMALGAAALQLLQDAALAAVPRRLHAILALPMQLLIAAADRCYTPRHRAREASVYVVVAERPHAEVGP